MILISILFICLVFYGIKVAPKNVFYDNEPSLQTSLSLKGICCIVIMMYHINEKIGVQLGIMPFAYIGYLATGTFFFLSGYGLMYSFLNKENYLNNFFKHRLLKILLPYLTANIIYFLIHIIFNDYVSIWKVAQSYIKGNPFVNYTWYIVGIIFFYLAFYIAFAFFKDSKKSFLKPNIIFTILNILYIFLCIKFKYGMWWYSTVFCFYLGLIYYQNIKHIQNFIRKKYFFKLATIFILFSMCFILVIKSESFYIYAVNLSSLLFVILLVMILNKVKFSNIISRFLGKISFEIYMYHGLALLIFAKYFQIHNNTLLVYCVILTTIIISYSNLTIIVRYIRQ